VRRQRPRRLTSFAFDDQVEALAKADRPRQDPRGGCHDQVDADGSCAGDNRKGSKDHPLLKRYEGSFIVAHDPKAFAEFVLPLSRLEEVPGKKDHKNVRAYEPKQKKALEGATMRLVYVIPPNRSPLEVMRNYQDEVRAKGGKILYECKAEECGGKPQGGSEGWAGHMTLARFLYPDDRITDPFGSNGWCAMTRDVADARYAAAELPNSGAHVSVYTYTLKVGSNQYCQALNDRTIAIVDVIEAKEREQKMVTVQHGPVAATRRGRGGDAFIAPRRRQGTPHAGRCFVREPGRLQQDRRWQSEEPPRRAGRKLKNGKIEWETR